MAFDSDAEAEAFARQHTAKPAWEAEGIKAAEPVADAERVLERLRADWEQAKHEQARRERQIIKFPNDYAMLVFLGDQHLGDEGTDYPRLFAEAETIAGTEGMYAASLGDMLDNFIKAKLSHIRFRTRASIPDEAVAAREYLGILGPKLWALVEGNHEWWTQAAAGVDYVREMLAQIAPDCLWDNDDCRVTVRVGAYEWRVRMRHDWPGSSMYNITHGVERGALFDGGFDIGVGAHTHRSGVARGFNNHGGSGLAVLVGTYKRLDPFSRQKGFHKANNSTAVAVLLDGISGAMVGFEDLDLAARVIGQLL